MSGISGMTPYIHNPILSSSSPSRASFLSPNPSYLPIPFLSRPSLTTNSSPIPTSSSSSCLSPSTTTHICNITSSSRLLKQSVNNPGNRELSQRTFREYSDVSMLNLTILLGNPGTGKSTASDYFKQGAKKRNLHTVFIEACESDLTVQYGIISRVFWGLVDPFCVCENLLQKLSFVDEVLRQLPVCSVPSEEHSAEGSSNLPNKNENENEKAEESSLKHSSCDRMERSLTTSSKTLSTRNVLLRILGLECSASFGMVEERSFFTVLDRRMSNTSTAPKGKYVCSTYVRAFNRIAFFSFTILKSFSFYDSVYTLFFILSYSYFISHFSFISHVTFLTYLFSYFCFLSGI